MTPGERLADAFAALADLGRRWPCRDRPEWTSDEPDDLRQAADACRSCPVIDACGEYAAQVRPTWGAWAGKVYAPRQPRRSVWQREGPSTADLPHACSAPTTTPSRAARRPPATNPPPGRHTGAPTDQEDT